MPIKFLPSDEMTVMLSDIARMENMELNEEILRLQGWEELPFPASPRWQKPGECLFSIPCYSTCLQCAMTLLPEIQKDFFRINIMSWDHTDNVTIQCDYRCGHNENPFPMVATGITMQHAIAILYVLYKRWKQKSHTE